jgi:cell division septation protein DedD
VEINLASKFQNRLVGTVILVALVVIFLPDLMDGNKLEQKDEAFAKIPLRPGSSPPNLRFRSRRRAPCRPSIWRVSSRPLPRPSGR